MVGPLPPDVPTVAIPDTLELSVQVLARPRPAADERADSPAQSREDPLWNLPIEVVGNLADDDQVAAGTVTIGYTASVDIHVTCRRGEVTRPAVDFDLP